ncbi:MAG: CRTAC1 family protein [Gammaproteobacteria bacterium]|nr:CRTAC1 family protein [Gammaproteobacteria bacterium]
MMWIRVRVSLGLCGIVALVSGCTPPSETAWFSEEARMRGIDFEHHSGFDGRPMMPEMMGGGVALADLDGDGDLDAYLVQSGRVDKTLAAEFSANRLYMNRGDGYFDEVEGAAGADDRGYGMGVAAGDYDNDGDIDLYVTNLGPNVLLRNDGTGSFTDVTAESGVGDPRWSTAANFVDLDLDDDLDLFVVNYINWTPEIERECFVKTFYVTYCGPTAYGVPAMDRLYRNNGDGTFTDVTKAAGIDVAFGNGLGNVAADFNADGLADLFVANDGTTNQLWMNAGGLRFKEECVLWSCAMDSDGIEKAGMGVASADVDDDGDSDLLVVNLERQTDSFFRNEGSYFFDATRPVGLGTTSLRHTRFGVALADFDNDGRLDLYEANGKIALSGPAEGDGYAEPNTLYRGSIDGDAIRFDELGPTGGVSPGLVHTSRAVASGDIDDDGGVDMVVINRDAPAYVLMNRANRGNWARFRVLAALGRDAHGATVSATVGERRLSRDVQPSASYLASNDPRVHFGIGNESQLHNVVVRWPGGSEEAFGDFVPGVHQLRQGEGSGSQLSATR